MMQERRMEGSPHRLIPTEGEGDVGDTPADFAARADPLNLSTSLKEVKRIVVVLSHARADGQDVRVEDDVLGVEANLLHQDFEGPLADAHLQTWRRNAIQNLDHRLKVNCLACKQTSQYRLAWV